MYSESGSRGFWVGGGGLSTAGGFGLTSTTDGGAEARAGASGFPVLGRLTLVAAEAEVSSGSDGVTAGVGDGGVGLVSG